MSDTGRSGQFRRILVICTRQIGDVLLTTPLLRLAKQRWPAASIDVLGHEAALGMLRGNPDVSELITVTPGAGWLRSWSLARRLWRQYDLAVITQRSDREYLYGWIAARVRVGLEPGNQWAYGWKRRLLHHAVPDSVERVHIVAEKLRLLEPWVPAAPHVRVVAPPPHALPPTIESRLSQRFVVIHAPSMWHYKQWPLEHYRQVVSGLLEDGVQVVLSGGPSDADRQQVAALLDLGESPRLLNVAGALSLNQLSGLLRRAALYIGPDTSVTHLAAACGVPVIAIFGPTNPVVWGPWPQEHSGSAPYVRQRLSQSQGVVTILQGPKDCVPCALEGCDRHRDSRSDCLTLLEPGRVLELARMHLSSPLPAH